MTDYDFPFSDLLKLYPACQHDVVRKQGCDLQNVLRYSKLCAAIQWNGVIGNVFAIQCGVTTRWSFITYAVQYIYR